MKRNPFVDPDYVQRLKEQSTMKIKVKIPVKVMANGEWISRGEGGPNGTHDCDNLDRVMLEWDHEKPLAIYWIEVELDAPIYNVDPANVTITPA